MMSQIERIETALSPLRATLTNHSVYKLLSKITDIKAFMESHVYAVWDFMSLLKALQNNLTCNTIPWKPSPNAKTARFINEIVLGEETDLNIDGIAKSHFEMYLDAMNEIGANTLNIKSFIDKFNALSDLDLALKQSNLKPAEEAFLRFTFETIQSNQTHKIASAFTFGREDLIPDMFIQILNESDQNYPVFEYYLQRHIELDGDEHGPLSLEMITELCKDDESKWTEVLEIAKEALSVRIKLWDEIASTIEHKKLMHLTVINEDSFHTSVQA